MGNWHTYLERHMRSVEGWLDPLDAKLIAYIAEQQRSAGLVGAMVEIGVHHGKLFLLLDALRQPSERSLAIDVFEDQKKNVDHSGHGDRKQFLDNLERLGGSAATVTVLAKSSLEVSAVEIAETVGRARIFSIDGGHTADCTRNDLELASATIQEGGLVILDDYFNPHWPNVSIGTAGVLADSTNRLLPFAVGPNKVLFSTASALDTYRAALRSQFAHVLVRTTEMAGSTVDVFGVLHTLPSFLEIVKMRLRRARFGKSIVRFGRAVRR